MVYNELLERGYDVYIGKTKDGEIDFIATKTEEKIYIQVTYLLESEKVINREFGAFEEIKDNYPKYVLTMDKFDFSQNGIIHKNVRRIIAVKVWNRCEKFYNGKCATHRSTKNDFKFLTDYSFWHGKIVENLDKSAF